MSLILILGLLIILLFIIGTLERYLHKRKLNKIPIRIHVNGTRGKSSVTRLIAAGLRANGIRTIAKTTGTLPRMILPNGKEQSIYRITRPNIIEQRKVVSYANAMAVEAIVIECMALQPNLQWVSERYLIAATHTVITNIREDHLEIMGPTESDVAYALAGSTPIGGWLFLGGSKYEEIYSMSCKDRKSKLVVVDEAAASSVDDSIVQSFPYIEHKENIAIAMRVLASLGCDPIKSIEGMINSTPDPGAMTVATVEYFDKTIHFVNGFAANDPYSSRMVLDKSREMFSEYTKFILIVNLRSDRADRTQQLSKEISSWTNIDAIIVVGEGGDFFIKNYLRPDSEELPIHILGEVTTNEIFESILSCSDNINIVLGIGNIAGLGLELTKFFEHRKKGNFLQ